MRSLLSLTVALCLLSSGAEAQVVQKGASTLLLRSGPELVKILIEKRADLTVGIVAGAIVTVGDHTLSSLFASDKAKADPVYPSDTPKWPKVGCKSLAAEVMTCQDAFTLPGERPVDSAELQKLLAGSELTPNPFLKKSAIIDPQKLLGERPIALVNPTAKYFDPPKEKDPDTKLFEPNTHFKPELLTVPAFSINLDDSLAWLSAKKLNTTEAYKNYMSDYPKGLHLNDALKGIAVLAALAPVPQVAPPPPPIPQLPCASTEDAMVAPIFNVQKAINSKDPQFYADQWFDESTFQDNLGKMNKFQLVADRIRAFNAWQLVHVTMKQYKVTPGSEGDASVADYFWVEIVGKNGNYSKEEVHETYHVQCALNGKWRILENVATAPTIVNAQ